MKKVKRQMTDLEKTFPAYITMNKYYLQRVPMIRKGKDNLHFLNGHRISSNNSQNTYDMGKTH